MNISKPVVDAFDWIGHQLTGIPLWIQAPTVIAVVVLLCAFSAFVLLRAIDILGARAYPLFNGGQHLPRVSLLPSKGIDSSNVIKQ
ncbi:hypothetical protein [Corynebacterium freiburgense]|uniref:hypothetical protein n=1 Tax=Corynebacterium freiburgense TaxID=556548 RepID=UPI0003F5A71D|nr:hypothetical protein [Corynebacterium freiburgense]WJZ03316.1 hypothetical protein CFREI_10210 [Corynebacterium freiburgense]